MYNTEYLKLIGFGLLILSILVNFSLFIIIKPKYGRGEFPLLLLLLIIYLFELLRGFSIKGIETFVCFFVSIIIYYVYSNVNIKTIRIRSLLLFFLCEIVFLFIPYFLGRGFNDIDGGYKSIYTTTTFLGVFSCMQLELCYIFYYYSRNKLWIVLMFLFIVLLWLTKVRTAYIGVIFVLLYFLLKRTKFFNNTKFFIMLKWIVFSTIVTFIVVYPILQQFEWFPAVEAFVYAYTDKILLSGRNEVWVEAINYIQKSPIIGHGLDISDILDIQFHSSYLQIILQSGFLGIGCIFLWINNCLNRIMKNDTSISKYIFICSLANILMSTTEVMLFQGQMILQTIIWMLIGMGAIRFQVKTT